MTTQEQLQQMEAELYQIRQTLFVLDQRLELFSPEVWQEEERYRHYRLKHDSYQAEWQPTQFQPITSAYAKTLEELAAENQRKIELEGRMAAFARQHGLTWQAHAITDFP